MKIAMKSVLSLSYLIVLTLTTFGIVDGTIDYGSLINDVYNEYMTRSLILVPSKNFLSFEKISFIQGVLKYLTARGISPLILNDMQLREGMKYHSRESHRLLVVIFLDELKAVHKFSEEVQHVDMNYSQKLVVFIGDSDKDHCKYCRHPIGNLLNLKFNSKMLVMCCESEYFEEWWFKRENQTSTIPRGKWIEGINQVNWYPEESITSNGLSMDNRGFRIVIMKGSMFAWRENNQLQGYIGEIFIELSRYMNFSISNITEENVIGSWNPESLSWSGAVGLISQGKADMGVGDFSMSSEQMHYIDFTVPLLTLKWALLIKKPDAVDILWNACFKPFQGKVWIAIIIFLLITPLSLAIIKYRRRDNFFDIISQHYLNVWGIFCQMPLPDSPYGASLRIVYLSTYMMAVVLSAAHSASFISYLTTTSSNLPFHSWEEFAQDGTYKLSLWRGRLNELKICIQKLAFFDSHIAIDSYLPCEIVAIPVDGVKNFAIILPLRSEYTKPMNHFLRQLEYTGITTRLRNKYFKEKDAADKYYEPVTLSGILPILIGSAVGFSVAFVIFVIEFVAEQLSDS